ncbi:MAG: endonuclease/exonuclease/phosphatase family protein [bacterium]|nr:endonuclease/exonuclease/phosphatase family protein [bacterium]
MLNNKAKFHFVLKWSLIKISIIAVLIWWAVGTSLPKHSHLQTNKVKNIKLAPINKTLTVATYNIAHGQGFKNHATDWRDEAYTRVKMQELTNAIKFMNADVIMLQEVDLNSNRTHRIDQIKWLVESLSYSFWACAPIWEKNYVPFPFWPLNHHIGEVKTANCILSKYPLSGHERVIFDKPASNPFWYNWGYIDRGAQKVNITIGSKQLTLVNVHLEDQDMNARVLQTVALTNWLKKSPGPMILGGDFNSIPRYASQKNNFADDPKSSFDKDTTINTILDSFNDETLAISREQYLKNEKITLTFPAQLPTRKLDHIFALKGAKVIRGHVVQEAKNASDHLPVYAEISF